MRESIDRLAPGSAAYRVLLVEDNQAEADLVMERLAESFASDSEVMHVATMAGACSACASHKFDCIVLDLQLPDSTGVETIREMRAQNHDAPIIAFSGRDNALDREAALREGALDFVSKNGSEVGSLDRGILLALERWRANKMRRQLETLLAASHDAVIVWGGDRRIRFVNAAARALLGCGEGDPVDGLLPPGVRDGSLDELAALSVVESPLGEMRIVACDWAGEPSLMATIRDLKEQRTLVEQLRQVQKAEAISRFTGGLTHDLANLLACIDVFADLAMKNKGEAESASLSDIKRAAESGRAIIRQLVALERGDDGADGEVIAPSEVLRELETFLRRSLPPTVRFTMALADGSARVRIGRSQLEQVVLNLVLNARDAMPDGGELCVMYAEPATGADGARVAAIDVRDTGVGIDPENVDRVFDLFFTSKAEGSGRGIGLAMSKTIVEKAGGAIAVKSQVGRGSTFTVTLPRVD